MTYASVCVWHFAHLQAVTKDKSHVDVFSLFLYSRTCTVVSWTANSRVWSSFCGPWGSYFRTCSVGSWNMDNKESCFVPAVLEVLSLGHVLCRFMNRGQQRVWCWSCSPWGSHSRTCSLGSWTVDNNESSFVSAFLEVRTSGLGLGISDKKIIPRKTE